MPIIGFADRLAAQTRSARLRPGLRPTRLAQFRQRVTDQIAADGFRDPAPNGGSQSRARNDIAFSTDHICHAVRLELAGGRLPGCAREPRMAMLSSRPCRSRSDSRTGRISRRRMTSVGQTAVPRGVCRSWGGGHGHKPVFLVDSPQLLVECSICAWHRAPSGRDLTINFAKTALAWWPEAILRPRETLG
jgi:hypothetical protein